MEKAKDSNPLAGLVDDREYLEIGLLYYAQFLPLWLLRLLYLVVERALLLTRRVG